LIEVKSVSRSFGQKQALKDVSFSAPAGMVTGFVGPNGAGKTTLMRIVMGLDRADNGAAHIDGSPFAKAVSPLRTAGALISPEWLPSQRSALDTLLAVARTNGIDDHRAHEMLELVELSHVAKKKVGTYSVGMRQRLGLAIALVGDPKTLVLDEPVNGLDPEGVLWLRSMLRSMAEDGRTILLSSHLMSELALIADKIVVIAQGQVVAEQSMADLLSQGDVRVYVEAERCDELLTELRAAGYKASSEGKGLLVAGGTSQEINRFAFERGIVLDWLTVHKSTLEEVFLRLTNDKCEGDGKIMGVGL
jgi:ABC-2 type transport system ATP-binding protein